MKAYLHGKLFLSKIIASAKMPNKGIHSNDKKNGADALAYIFN